MEEGFTKQEGKITSAETWRANVQQCAILCEELLCNIIWRALVQYYIDFDNLHSRSATEETERWQHWRQNWRRSNKKKEAKEFKAKEWVEIHFYWQRPLTEMTRRKGEGKERKKMKKRVPDIYGKSWRRKLNNFLLIYKTQHIFDFY